jgi:hypothetical protein
MRWPRLLSRHSPTTRAEIGTHLSPHGQRSERSRLTVRDQRDDETLEDRLRRITATLTNVPEFYKVKAYRIDQIR